MKKSLSFEIDFLTKTITVSKQFPEKAGQMDETAYAQMERLLSMNMKMVVAQPARRRKSIDKKNAKPARITYDKMVKYIACLNDANEMRKKFDSVRECSKGQPNPYQYVYEWFHKEFPNYADLPALDENNHIIHKTNILPLAPAANQ